MAKKYDAFLCHHSQDKPIIEQIAQWLEDEAKLSVWLDKWNLIAGDPWLEEIEIALDESKCCVVFFGPNGIGPWQNEEMRSALEEKVSKKTSRVIPVLLPGAKCIEKNIPRFIKRLTWVIFKGNHLDPEALRRLSDGIQHIPYRRDKKHNSSKDFSIEGTIHYAPSLPLELIERNEDIKEIKQKILSRDNQYIALTGKRLGLAIHGMGGIGKTVIANMLAHDKDIAKAFPNDIIWITLGQEPNIIARQDDILFALEGQKFDIKDEQNGKNLIEESLKTRRVLLILDDVWKFEHVKYFNVIGDQCCLIITTRNAGIVRDLNASEHCVDVFAPEVSLIFLSKWTKCPVESLPKEAEEVSKECGYLPLALAMIGAMVRRRPETWAAALTRLKNSDIDKIKSQFPDYSYPDVLKALQVSVDALSHDLRTYYLDFAVFPEDIPIPKVVFYTYWASEGKDKYDIDDILYNLSDLSLIKIDNKEKVTLHDLQFDYIRKQVSDVTTLHKKLLDKYKSICTDGWYTGPNDGHFFEYLAYHMYKAKEVDALRTLLTNFNWMQTKLEVNSPFLLIKDYEYLKQDNELSLIQGAIKLSSHIIYKDKIQLAGQLVGRLMSHKKIGNGIKEVLEAAAQYKPHPWLYPLTQNLTTPGGSLIYTLTGHNGGVDVVAITPDGYRAISFSDDDNSLRAWDLENGVELPPFAGFVRDISTLAFLPDGQHFISANHGLIGRLSALLLWDLESRGEVCMLTTHTSDLKAVTVRPDGCIISGSRAGTFAFWDIESGEKLRMVSGKKRSQEVGGIVFTPDGLRAVVWSHRSDRERTLKLWDLEKGVELRTFKTGYTEPIEEVTIAPNGRWAISTSRYDNTLKVWDLETGIERLSLVGHTNVVSAVIAMPDSRRVISASRDNTLRIWDFIKGEDLRIIDHKTPFHLLTLMPDGSRAVTVSSDEVSSSEEILRIWDLESGTIVFTLKGYSGHIYRLAVTPDNRLAVSVSYNFVLKVWSLANRKVLYTIKTSHKNRIITVLVTADGRRIITGSEDHTIKVWDLESGKELHTLSDYIEGRFAVASDVGIGVSTDDNAINVWDLKRGMIIRKLVGHKASIKTITVTQDGRLAVSWSKDKTIKVWDLESGKEVQTFLVHRSPPHASTVDPNGRYFISGSVDGEIKVWDLAQKTELYTIAGHKDPIMAIAVTPDCKHIVSASRQNNSLEVRDIMNGKVLFSLEGHTRFINAIVFSKDGRRMVTGSQDKTLKVWDWESALKRSSPPSHSGPVYSAAITPDIRRLVSAQLFGKLKLWDLKSLEVLYTLEEDNSLNTEVAILPDSNHAISANNSIKKLKKALYYGVLKLWDLDRGALLFSLTGHKGPINKIAVTPDGKHAITASGDTTLKVWDLKHGTELKTLKGHEKGVWAVAISPDGRWIISGAEDGMVKIWDLSQGIEKHTMKSHDSYILSVLVTPDCRSVISLSTGSVLKIWDIHSGNEVDEVTLHKSFPTAMAITPDGERVVCNFRTGALDVWNLKQRKRQFVFTTKRDNGSSGLGLSNIGLPFFVKFDTLLKDLRLTPEGKEPKLKIFDTELTSFSTLAVTPDGRNVVSTIDTNTLVVWDLNQGAVIARYTAEYAINTCTIALDGLTIAAGDSSGQVHILRLENVMPGPPIVTAWNSLSQAGEHFRRRNKNYAYGCPFCRRWSKISKSALGNEFSCPKCSNLVKLNMFTINGDWRPVAKAWKKHREDD